MKFVLNNFDEAVNKAVGVEKALEQQSLTLNVLNSIPISNNNQNLDIQILLKPQVCQNKKISDLTESKKNKQKLKMLLATFVEKHIKRRTAGISLLFQIETLLTQIETFLVRREISLK